MRFFIDTCVFYDDWYLTSPNLRLLFHFMNNNSHDLLISKVVVQEMENLRARELSKVIAALKQNISKAKRLNGKTPLESDGELVATPYNFLDLLQEKVESTILIEYSSISHVTVVERALNARRPFLEGEKGYRDTLIWLSLLDYVRSSKSDEEIVFITVNKSDFFDAKSVVPAFHSDLVRDLASLDSAIKVTPFDALSTFVVSTIDKDQHAIDHTKAEDLFGEYIEREGLNYLETLNPEVLDELTSTLLPGSNALSHVLSIAAVLYEGIEDFTVISTKNLGDGDIYVSCRYDLRGVVVTIEIPAADYHLNHASIAGSGRYYDVELTTTSAKLAFGIRPLYSVDFLYSPKDENLRGYTVSDFSVRL